jgi:regulator of replication initiation timing
MVSGSLQVPIAASDDDATNTGAGASQVAVPKELRGVASEDSREPASGNFRDWARLERAVKALVAAHASLSTARASLAEQHSNLTAEHGSLLERHALLIRENVTLRADLGKLEDRLGEAMAQGRRLEQRLLAENQRRQDALKRVDELIERIGALLPAVADRAAPTR